MQARSAGRALGVDIGSRRVGLALSDPTRLISSPLSTVSLISEKALVHRIAMLCQKHDVRTVVIGLPLSADGSEGPGCARARRVAEALARLGICAELQDESWSSRDAEEALREMGASRRGLPEKVDAIAASLILREYLEEDCRP
ncbi:MAG: Holliday junction resolvase RuvX [Spirochaetia bacterium]|jgi:putative Holliday junction resolvase